jgi:hypothetical protein
MNTKSSQSLSTHTCSSCEGAGYVIWLDFYRYSWPSEVQSDEGLLVGITLRCLTLSCPLPWARLKSDVVQILGAWLSQ